MLILVFKQKNDEFQYFGEVKGRKHSLRIISKYLTSRKEYYMMENTKDIFSIYERWLGGWLSTYIGQFFMYDTGDAEFILMPELEFGKYGVLANLPED